MNVVRVVMILLVTVSPKQKEACTTNSLITRTPKKTVQKNTEVIIPDTAVQRPVEYQYENKKQYMPIPPKQDEPPEIIVHDHEILEKERIWAKDHVALVQEPVSEKDSADQENSKSRIEALGEKLNNFPEPDGECKVQMSFAEYMSKNGMELSMDNSWNKFFAETTNCYMYKENSDVVEQLIKSMSSSEMEIIKVKNFRGGNQMKLLLTFKNKMQALFKPMRFGANYESDPKQYYFDHIERPNAEIAAFHLDKLLGFRRAVPTTGRKISIPNELIAKSPIGSDVKYFYSPANNLCFFGRCDQFCNTAHAVCGSPDTVYGSVQAFIPKQLELTTYNSPYHRITEPDRLAKWQNDETKNGYCDEMKKKEQFASFREGRRLLDLIDLHILDFITGNKDRHHYYLSSINLFKQNGDHNQIFMIPLDNGRGFDDLKDDPEILAPLTQCCVVRPSTVNTLLKFYAGSPSLSEKLQESLQNEVFPVLSKKYFTAIDRRVGKILEAVADCIDAKDPEKVFVNILKHVAGERYVTNKRRMVTAEITTEGKAVQLYEQRNAVPATKLGDEWRRLQKPSLRNGPDDEAYRRPAIDDKLVEALRDNWEVEKFLDSNPECPKEISLKQHMDPPTDESTWKFESHITSCGLYAAETDERKNEIVDQLLKDMSKASINLLQPSFGHDQMKFILTFDNDKKSIFTPMRFDRNYETNPNHFYFDDFDRHHAEIAAFNLDRLLGFRRVLPVVEREFDIEHELKEHKDDIMIKFFHSPDNKHCFHAINRRSQYSDSAHAACGNPEKILGSVQLQLSQHTRTHLRIIGLDSPYRKSYSENDYKIKSEQNNAEYCSELKTQEPYNHGRRLLDLVDLYIFDFLTGNNGRELYLIVRFPMEDAEPYLLVEENGKAFGNPRSDDLRILAPLIQCCVVRPSTVKTLLKFYSGPVSLAQKLDETIPGVLAQKYLAAIDRRVGIVLRKVLDCIEQKKGVGKVLMNRFKHTPDPSGIDENTFAVSDQTEKKCMYFMK